MADQIMTPEEAVSRIMGACLPHLWEGRCVRHHSIIHPDNDTCVVAQDAAGFIRARDAEVRAEVRAYEREKVLEGFTEETRTREDGYAGASSVWDKAGRTQTTTTFIRPATRERRIVGPWEPTP